MLVRTAKMFVKNAALPSVLVATSLLGLCWAEPIQLKQGCKVETLRACGDTYLPYWKTTRLEVSGEPLRKNCQIYREQIECSRNFTRECAVGVPRAAALLGLEAFQDNVDATCTVGTKSYEEYQKAIGCMNSVGAKLNGCFRGLHDNLEKALVKAPTKDTINYSCCSYAEMVDCFERVLTPCEDVGGKQLTLTLVEQVFGETLSLVCGSYKRGSESCRSLPELPALGPNDPKYDGFVELVLEIASTFGRKD